MRTLGRAAGRCRRIRTAGGDAVLIGTANQPLLDAASAVLGTA
jgi:hypothetical protein